VVNEFRRRATPPVLNTVRFAYTKGVQKMADRPVFLYAAVYDEIADAEADYEAVFDLHACCGGARGAPRTRRTRPGS
jgi:hypothetical protein